MQMSFGEYEFDSAHGRLQLDAICELLSHTYWAADRPVAAIASSIDHSLCYGIYFNGQQIGFARVITDFSTIFWLCDVVIDCDHREKGLGKELIKFVLSDPALRGLNAFLATMDAFGLYEKYGFIKSERFMYRPGTPAVKPPSH